VSPLDIASLVLLSAGGVFCVIGAIGMLRMPDFYTRAHAASVIETLGAALVIVGLMLQAGWTLASAKLLCLGLLIFFTSQTATHALVKAARERGVEARTAEPPA
jgi:multicomponent Na+:H+ antiporter subunit G